VKKNRLSLEKREDAYLLAVVLAPRNGRDTSQTGEKDLGLVKRVSGGGPDLEVTRTENVCIRQKSKRKQDGC